MKKLWSKLFILLLAFTIAVPTLAFAEDEEEVTDEENVEETEETVTKDPVTIYFFRGEGCPHCAEAEEWFESIEEEYGDYFDIQDYEVWYDESNKELMNSVAEYMGRNTDNLGVPYMIIGEHDYSGFDAKDTDTILNYIKEEYEKNPSDRAQIVPTVIEETGWGEEEDTKTRDLIVGLVLVAIIVGLVVVIIKARKED